jgi:hypothetical protein
MQTPSKTGKVSTTLTSVTAHRQFAVASSKWQVLGNNSNKSKLKRVFENRMDLTEIGWEGVDWMHLGQNSDQWRALANTVMNFRVP